MDDAGHVPQLPLSWWVYERHHAVTTEKYLQTRSTVATQMMGATKLARQLPHSWWCHQTHPTVATQLMGATKLALQLLHSWWVPWNLPPSCHTADGATRLAPQLPHRWWSHQIRPTVATSLMVPPDSPHSCHIADGAMKLAPQLPHSWWCHQTRPKVATMKYAYPTITRERILKPRHAKQNKNLKSKTGLHDGGWSLVKVSFTWGEIWKKKSLKMGKRWGERIHQRNHCIACKRGKVGSLQRHALSHASFCEQIAWTDNRANHGLEGADTLMMRLCNSKSEGV